MILLGLLLFFIGGPIFITWLAYKVFGDKDNGKADLPCKGCFYYNYIPEQPDKLHEERDENSYDRDSSGYLDNFYDRLDDGEYDDDREILREEDPDMYRDLYGDEDLTDY